MCGIAGIINSDGRLDRETMVTAARAMAKSMGHRGPDDMGLWIDPDNRCVLVHRRLSIIDLSAGGHQPMQSHDQRAVVTYNGELYNYVELREQLAAAGETFASQSDTEVFLAGLRRHGPWFFTLADAMFAIALWDRDRGELLLGRDPFGEKPLYYTRCNGAFAFASELAALTLVPGFDSTVTHDTIAAYLATQFIPAPGTIYRNCHKLEAGSYMRVTAAGPGPAVRYFTFSPGGETTAAGSLDEQADALEDVLVRSLRRRLVSDVPLGAFLSGGVDSSTVVALAAHRLNRSIQTFTIGFTDTPESEHHYARDVAQHLGLDHHEELQGPDVLALGLELAARMDEPNVDSSCAPTYLVSKLARRTVTVALTGDGGDELFGGYTRYFDCMAAADAHAEDIAVRRWHRGRDYYSGRVLVYHDSDLIPLFGRVPTNTADLLLSWRREVDLDARPLINVLREMDARHYLPVVLAKVDRMSMLNSLECRTPFLSPEVAQFAASLPVPHIHRGDEGKRVLKHLAARHLPQECIYRRKMGFGLPTADGWSTPRVLAELRRLLAEDECRLLAWFSRSRLEEFLSIRGPSLSLYQAWALMVLEIWLRHHPATNPGDVLA